MKSHQLNISSTVIIILVLFILLTSKVKAQAPLIDQFTTSIDFTDRLIDTKWSTLEAHQLLATNTSTLPDESDLSGYWKAGYNKEDQLFYLLIEIKDDTITSEVLIDPDSTYNADHITIYFDLYNDGFSSYSDGYFTFTLFPETDQYLGRIGATSFSIGNYNYITSVDKNTTTDGWFVEALFSFKDLMSMQEVLFIDTIGFEAVITDNDKGVGQRDYRLSWYDPNVTAWENPSGMRDIILDQKLDVTFKPVCSADFDYEVTSDYGAEQVQVSFTDQSTTNDNIINWSWELGDASFSFFKNPGHTYNPFVSNTNACLYITTGYGCNKSICKTITLPPEQFSLTGKVRGDVNTSNDWKVVAFQEEEGGYVAVDSYSLDGEDFEFTTLIEGNCILYALPEKVDQNYIPTYFVNSEHWQQCENIQVNGAVYDVDILLNEYSFNISGPGSINGNLQQQQEGVPIVLTGENGHLLKYALTNASGEYSFNELPYGNYILYPEYPGIDNSATNIQLNAEQPEFDLNSLSTKTDYRINYNREQKELIISLKGQICNTTISIYNTLGELIYSDKPDSFKSKTIFTGNLNATILLIQVWDGNRLTTKKVIK